MTDEQKAEYIKDFCEAAILLARIHLQLAENRALIAESCSDKGDFHFDTLGKLAHSQAEVLADYLDATDAMDDECPNEIRVGEIFNKWYPL